MTFNIDDECCSQAYNAGYMLGSADKEVIIIKLLENAIDHDWKSSEPCEACDQTDYLIALIKGSQKDNETVVLLTEGEIK